MPAIASQTAKVISGLASPFIVLSVFGILSILSLKQPVEKSLIQIFLYLALIVGTPLIYILISIRRGTITNLHVTLREQRPAPFVAATLGSLLVLIIYLTLKVPPALIAIAVSVLVCGIIFTATTVYWKISIHAAAYAGSVLIFSLVIQDFRFLLLELFLPIIIWARLQRKRHNIYQAIVAAALACLSIYLTFTLAPAT